MSFSVYGNTPSVPGAMSVLCAHRLKPLVSEDDSILIPLYGTVWYIDQHGSDRPVCFTAPPPAHPGIQGKY